MPLRFRGGVLGWPLQRMLDEEWLVRGVVRAVPLPLGRLSTVAVARDWTEPPRKGVFVQAAADRAGISGAISTAVRPLRQDQIHSIIAVLRVDQGRCDLGEAGRLEFDLIKGTMFLRAGPPGLFLKLGARMPLDLERLNALREAFVELHEVDASTVVYPRAADEDDWSHDGP